MPGRSHRRAALPCKQPPEAGARADELLGFAEKPSGAQLEEMAHASRNATSEKPYEASMGIYVFSKDVLVELLADPAEVRPGKLSAAAAGDVCMAVSSEPGHSAGVLGLMRAQASMPGCSCALPGSEAAQRAVPLSQPSPARLARAHPYPSLQVWG